jgi:hypothetical protein
MDIDNYPNVKKYIENLDNDDYKNYLKYIKIYYDSKFDEKSGYKVSFINNLYTIENYKTIITLVPPKYININSEFLKIKNNLTINKKKIQLIRDTIIVNQKNLNMENDELIELLETNINEYNINKERMEELIMYNKVLNYERVELEVYNKNDKLNNLINENKEDYYNIININNYTSEWKIGVKEYILNKDKIDKLKDEIKILKNNKINYIIKELPKINIKYKDNNKKDIEKKIFINETRKIDLKKLEKDREKLIKIEKENYIKEKENNILTKEFIKNSDNDNSYYDISTDNEITDDNKKNIAQKNNNQEDDLYDSNIESESEKEEDSDSLSSIEDNSELESESESESENI